MNVNMTQPVNGKAGTQTKASGKADDAANGDFLMALFAAGGQQTAKNDVEQLLGEGLDPDQQQSTTDDLVLEMLMATGVAPQQFNLPVDNNKLIVEPQTLLEMPKQVGVELLEELNNVLSNPQLKINSESKDLLKQLQLQLQSQTQLQNQSELIQVDAKFVGKLEGLLVNSQQPAELQPLVTAFQEQLKQQQLLQTSMDVVPKDELSELTNLRVDNLKLDNVQFNMQQQNVTSLKQQSELSTDLPKVTVIPQNKSTIEMQPVEQSNPKQDVTTISQFVKPATDRPVEQVFQQYVKDNETPMQTASKPTISTQSTDSQNFATVTNDKVVGMDAKLEQVEPAQVASRLLGMVREMATKQQPNQTTMQLKLTPEHLGEVTVRLTYNRGELNAQFYAATTHGKEALEAALPLMRDALFQQQVKLNDATVYLNNGNNQWLGGRQGNHGRDRGKGQGGYNNNYSIQPKVSAASIGGNKVVDDGLNILV